MMLPQADFPPVHVIGATGRSGIDVCSALIARGISVVPVVRDPMKWRASGLAGTPRRADLRDPEALGKALADARRVVSCAHARHAPAILAAAANALGFVFLGSTRRFTRWPDAHGSGVIAGEQALMASGRSGVMLHPTMIYGASGEDNVQRLAALLARLPLVPLPGGGRALVQPIHQSDVTRSVLAALEVAWEGPRALVIAGPFPLPYADFVRAVAKAAGLPKPRIVGVPAWPLMLAAPLTSVLPKVPRIGVAEIRRLLEDKAFAIDEMQSVLGVRPIGLEEGLGRTFN